MPIRVTVLAGLLSILFVASARGENWPNPDATVEELKLEENWPNAP